MYVVYILYSSSIDQYYIGHTSNLKDRLRRHNAGRSKATKHGIPWEVKYTQTFTTKLLAYRRELQLKAMKSKVFIKNLIDG
ncbi:MAG: GIY-YIG nuclease family protein [Flavobacteriaceae bacterium]|nr:GIY-YIG nuclease family protein [Flavobacteriaceae bacterium]